MMPGAVILREEARTHVSNPLSLRSYLVAPIGAGLALLLVWPRAPLASIMRVGPAPNPFDVVAVCLVLLGLYLGARHGSEDYTPSSATNLRDYVRFTPVSLAGIVLGKAIFAVAHTAFLLLLGAPFLLAASAVGGVTGAQVLLVLAMTAVSCLCVRMLGLLVLVIVRSGPLLRDVILLPLIALAIVLTLLFLPLACPLDAVIGRSPRQALISIGISLTMALVFAVGAAFSLRIMRRPDA
jgi:hypothetical protein